MNWQKSCQTVAEPLSQPDKANSCTEVRVTDSQAGRRLFINDMAIIKWHQFKKNIGGEEFQTQSVGVLRKNNLIHQRRTEDRTIWTIALVLHLEIHFLLHSNEETPEEKKECQTLFVEIVVTCSQMPCSFQTAMWMVSNFVDVSLNLTMTGWQCLHIIILWGNFLLTIYCLCLINISDKTTNQC